MPRDPACTVALEEKMMYHFKAFYFPSCNYSNSCYSNKNPTPPEKPPLLLTLTSF